MFLVIVCGVELFSFEMIDYEVLYDQESPLEFHDMDGFIKHTSPVAGLKKVLENPNSNEGVFK